MYCEYICFYKYSCKFENHISRREVGVIGSFGYIVKRGSRLRERELHELDLPCDRLSSSLIPFKS